MRSPALGLAWGFWSRHRIALSLFGGYLLLLVALLQPAIVSAAWPLGRSPVSGRELAMLCALPVWVGFIYLLAVFSYGFEVDVLGAGSAFPRRLLALPVRTIELVAWPMLYGATSLALGWLLLAGVVLPRFGLQPPVVWPALLFAAAVAWTQALTWSPFRLRFVRIGGVLLVVIALMTTAGVGVELQVPESLLALVCAALGGAAFGVALRGVRLARRGDEVEWAWPVQFVERIVERLRHRTQPFRSPAEAQSWIETRLHGLLVPLLAACLWAAVTACLFLEPRLQGLPLLLVTLLLLPPFAAGVAGSGLRGPSLLPFVAVRPLSDADLVVAKMRVAVPATLVTWGCMVPAAALAIVVTGKYEEFAQLWQRLFADYSTLRLVGALFLILACLVILTWKMLVDGLLVHLSGREWLIRTTQYAVGAGLLFVSFGAAWLYHHPAYWGMLFAALPWAAAGAVTVKGVATAWALQLVRRHRLLSTRTLLAAGITWGMVAVALGAVAVAVGPLGPLPRGLLVLIVVLCLPGAQALGAFVAMHGNRHRG